MNQLEEIHQEQVNTLLRLHLIYSLKKLVSSNKLEIRSAIAILNDNESNIKSILERINAYQTHLQSGCQCRFTGIKVDFELLDNGMIVKSIRCHCSKSNRLFGIVMK